MRGVAVLGPPYTAACDVCTYLRLQDHPGIIANHVCFGRVVCQALTEMIHTRLGRMYREVSGVDAGAEHNLFCLKGGFVALGCAYMMPAMV